MKKKIILASKSPRRHELIKGLELDYDIHSYDIDETFPVELKSGEIALYLAEKKAMAYPEILQENEILLTADTIVWVNGHVLNKPVDAAEALQMLQEICGTTHEVYTGICLRDQHQIRLFAERSEVTCKAASEAHLIHYIETYHPFDKAGGYGIQDWFGYTVVEKINGCFYNVMGLPVSRIYQELQSF
ncbi:MAG: Maf family nucleotide pyrophosphatase [Bacteroidia bacterium]|jgi:septum formation protein